MAIGNIIGSNIANVLLIGGIAGIINPLIISTKMLYIGIPAMLFMTLLFLFLARFERDVKLNEGIILILFYIIFIILFFLVKV